MRITETKRTTVPRWGIGADGYTRKTGAPTATMVKLEGEKRWRRLKIYQFSNASSLFLTINGKDHFVQPYDIPE